MSTPPLAKPLPDWWPSFFPREPIRLGLDLQGGIHLILQVEVEKAVENALNGAMESTTFDIDNLPPVITVTGTRRDGTRTIVTFDVRDEHSAVQKADYSLDGDRWQTIYPKDGIPDSRSEQFELVLEGEAAARGVVIRAADSLNNLASTRGDAAPTR